MNNHHDWASYRLEEIADEISGHHSGIGFGIATGVSAERMLKAVEYLNGAVKSLGVDSRTWAHEIPIGDLRLLRKPTDHLFKGAVGLYFDATVRHMASMDGLDDRIQELSIMARSAHTQELRELAQGELDALLLHYRKRAIDVLVDIVNRYSGGKVGGWANE